MLLQRYAIDCTTKVVYPLKMHVLAHKQRYAIRCTTKVVYKKGGEMELKTIKEYAESQKVTYEAVRKQIVNYEEELSGHIVRKGRTQYLDEWAVSFLTARRRENPVIFINQTKDSEIEELKQQIETLRTQLLTAQNELLKSQDERLRAQDRIIALQDEARKTFEERARYTALFEESRAKDEELKKAGDREADLLKQMEEKDHQLMLATESASLLQSQLEESQQAIEGIGLERDEAIAEAQSYEKSFFGFYRKSKKENR